MRMICVPVMRFRYVCMRCVPVMCLSYVFPVCVPAMGRRYVFMVCVPVTVSNMRNIPLRMLMGSSNCVAYICNTVIMHRVYATPRVYYTPNVHILSADDYGVTYPFSFVAATNMLSNDTRYPGIWESGKSMCVFHIWCNISDSQLRL